MNEITEMYRADRAYTLTVATMALVAALLGTAFLIFA
ncbi:hypothetical protein J2S58_000244 [Nakamurella flavida]|nr:hypothetical protein [Nakamurella flavida]